ncbi:MAG: transcription termination/antitermination factor NusG [Ruminococcaceae bacterium]|nr:transcription termination/antitermination factor NusG [Oscillospiraceae bacterium]MEE1137837.1 transcription termination/antitermination protein NusG [Acutalibacteraceae bacterium]
MAIDARWYVVHTYSGYEKKVATNIEKMVENRKMQDQILEVTIPVETVTDIEKNKTVERLLFPGYVLVKVAVTPDRDNRPAMSDETWLLIRNTRGVTGFVGPENKAIPLTDEEVIRLGVEKRVVEVSYKVGDTVNIIDEIFDGFTGVVEELDVDNNMVKVSVSALFGKQTTVELELDQVELAE